MIHGVAKDVKVKIGEWLGTLDFTIVIVDDYPCVLGMEFIDKVKAIHIPFVNSMCIMEDGNFCTIPLAQGKSGHGSHFRPCNWVRESGGESQPILSP